MRKRAEFLRVQASSHRVSTRHLLFLIEPTEPTASSRLPSSSSLPSSRCTGTARLGVVASRKVGGAVERNRCKRLVREAFRRHATELPRGIDIVVIVRPGTHLESLATIEAEFVRAAGQIAKRRRS